MKLSKAHSGFLLVAGANIASALPSGYLQNKKLQDEHDSNIDQILKRNLRKVKTRRGSKSGKNTCTRADIGSNGVDVPLLGPQLNIDKDDVPDFLNSTTNYWAPPGPDDVRSPCPFLNTAANHGLINRSGKDIDLFDMAEVVSNTFGLSIDFNLIISSMTASLGIASPPDENNITRVDLDDLCQHNIQEHDSSLFRNDFFLDKENHCNVDASLLFDVLQANPTSDTITRAEMQSFLVARITHSRKNNPQFNLTEVAVLEIAAQYMTIFLIDSEVNRPTTFESIKKSRVAEMMMFERIPQGFSPPNVHFLPVVIDQNEPLGARPYDPNRDDSANVDISTVTLPEFLGAASNALGADIDTCPDEGGDCIITDDCCPGFVCVSGGVGFE